MFTGYKTRMKQRYRIIKQSRLYGLMTRGVAHDAAGRVYLTKPEKGHAARARGTEKDITEKQRGKRIVRRSHLSSQPASHIARA